MTSYFMGPHPTPPESASRALDEMVQRQEMPYGYEGEPPSADTGDFNQSRLETHKIQRVK
jgi:hypothetical protein